MTDAELAEIEKACAEASEGPWSTERDDFWKTWTVNYGATSNVVITPEDHVPVCEKIDQKADAHFIAESREWLPALVAEVKRLKKESMILCMAITSERERRLEAAKGRPKPKPGDIGVRDFLKISIPARNRGLEEAAEVAEQSGHSNMATSIRAMMDARPTWSDGDALSNQEELVKAAFDALKEGA